MQEGPLLGRESENRDLFAMRRDVVVQRVFTADICNVLEAGHARARNSEGIDRDEPEAFHQ